MANVAASLFSRGEPVVYTGGSSDNDNEVLLEVDVEPFDTFEAFSAAGSFDVQVSFDGTTYAAAPLAMSDLGTASATPIIASVATKVAGFRGAYKKLKFAQTGATAVTGFQFIAKRTSFR